MAKLTVRFINAKDIISKLIGWQTNSLWCHTEALSRDGQHWIGAHAGTGVQARKLEWCKGLDREAVYEIEVTDQQYEAAMSWLESQIGKPYDYKDILGLTLHVRIGASEHEVICSTCMTAFLQKASIQPLNVLEGYDYLITPETLHLSPIFIGKKRKNTCSENSGH